MNEQVETGQGSMRSGINIDLIMPVLILFVMLRTKSIHNFGHSLLKGLRFFTPTTGSAVDSTAATGPSGAKTTDEIIELSLAKLQITMMEVDSSPKSKTILESQLFYSSYDVMVNLMICSVLSYLWSMAYHSVFPGANQSCLVVILLFVTGMFTLHSLLQIIYLTGLRAIETKLAITTGCFTFAANLILFALQLHAFSDSLTTAIGVHMQAMFMQLSPHMPIPSFLLSKFSAQIMLATLSSLIAACATFPAIRFAQSFVSIALVSDSSKVTTAKSDAEMRTMLWMDLLLPLFIAIICSPLPYWAYDRVAASDELCTLSPESAACEPQYAHLSSEGRSAVYECVLFNVQAVLVLLSLVLRVRCMRPHLQCFLDSLVKTVTEAMMAGQQANVAILHRKVKACTDYLMAAATQYVALPVLLLTCLILLHRNSPHGTGLGVVFTRVISPQQTPDLIRRVYEAAHFNSTAAAMQQAAAPYLVQVFNAVLGGKEPEAVLRAGVTDSSHLLPAYANKMAQVYFLPARAAIPLCRGLLCVISVAWFCLYVIGIVLWKYYPHILLRTTQKQQQGKEQ